MNGYNRPKNALNRLWLIAKGLNRITDSCSSNDLKVSMMFRDLYISISSSVSMGVSIANSPYRVATKRNEGVKRAVVLVKKNSV